LGEVEKGLEHARLGAELARSENALECACAGFYAVGMGELERQELRRALASFDTSLELGDQAGWEGWSGFKNRVHAAAAVAELRQGSPDAVADLEAALANARSDRDHYGAALAAENLVAALLEQGNAERAAAHLDAAIGYYREAEMRPYEVRALDRLAGVQERLGKAGDAAASRDRAAALRSELGLAAAGRAGSEKAVLEG
jgi:tetratricopeptide (TPR) repeat protein